LYYASVQNDADRLMNVERVMGNIREGWMNFGQQA
ncbi:flagellar protein FliS, partial [Vibrio chemaguriensis]|nr:flagellar protein FliS [Vibrio chemaguriensis]